MIAVLASVLATAVTGATAHHGIHHFDSDDPAGTIASYDSDSGLLTIDLAGGGTASGRVSRFTWIDCGDHHHWGFWHHRDRFTQHFGGDDEDRGDCTTDDLTAGRTVDDALLVLHDGEAVFWKVELAGDGSTTS